MNETTGSRRRWRRARRAGALAVAGGLVLVVAACGGNPSSNNSSGSPRFSQQLAYAQCMRSHGVLNFPDPDPGGGFGGREVPLESDPHYASADGACRHLVTSGGGGAPGSKVAQNLTQYDRYSACIRAHGFPKYPDPNPNPPGPQEFAQLGINPNSPQFEAAASACDHYLPTHGGGS